MIENMPDNLKQKYESKEITLDDIIENIENLKSIQISKLISDEELKKLEDFLGNEKLHQFIEAFPELFKNIIENKRTKEYLSYIELNKLILNGNELNEIQSALFNIYEVLLNSENPLEYKRLNSKQLQFYIENPGLLNINAKINNAINIFGIENIKKLNSEIGLITNNDETKLFDAIVYFLRYKDEYPNFKNGQLPYEEFKNEFANLLEEMKQRSVFADYPNYDWIEGKFREEHPEIFIVKDAPENLKKAFYCNRITPTFLYTHKEYIEYLKDKNLTNTIRANIKLKIRPNINDRVYPDSNNTFYAEADFISEYIRRFDSVSLLILLAKYGTILENIKINNFNDEISSIEEIEKSLRQAIYKKIQNEDINYQYLSNIDEFVKEYPEIFIDLSNEKDLTGIEKDYLTKAFYSRELQFKDIRKYPILVSLLKDKKLDIAFQDDFNKCLYDSQDKNKLLNKLGNENFLKICSEYGAYLSRILNNLILELEKAPTDLSIQEIKDKIEYLIVKNIKEENMKYGPNSAPDFLKEKHPELFLSEDAEEELKKYFYNSSNNYNMSFEVLQKHKDWLPFLKGKAIATSLLINSPIKQDMIKFFKVFGEEKAIKLGINRAETVTKMLKTHQVDLMKSWYDKTGGKFIPDFVVMETLKLEEADKFLASGSNWSNLMKIKTYSKEPVKREAMLRFAYLFGAFDQDQRGYKKLMDLLTGIPRKIDDKHVVKRLDDVIEAIRKANIQNNEKVPITININNLIKELQNENINIDFSKPIFSQIYKQNEDGTYTLTFNAQSYPKISSIVREILECQRDFPILSPEKLSYYLGDISLEYNPDFREFFLENFNEIIKSDIKLSKIATIQQRFNEIKAIYSNVNLTLDLAMSYIDNNKYTKVNVGNEKVSQTAALMNYTQQQFETLQQIYNYGKQRTFSSIPRIVSDSKIELPTGNYYYEMLRLDDPRAMSIGFETDCCQELGETAEICMEHSMVDKNGRVFIVTNDKGEVVAQSWVWRNKNVLCFDNIEVPDKKMWDNGIEKGHEDDGIRNQFTDDVLDIYKIASKKLIGVDETKYKQLLESGKITQEEYENLKLSKITTGLGWSNIKGSYVTLKLDEGILSRPHKFNEPVKLEESYKTGLYIKDSNTQYILEEKEGRKDYEGKTLPVHSDSYIEYTDSNFTEKSLLTLKKLELITKENPNDLDITSKEFEGKEHMVTEIAKEYYLNPETTKIIMNPNFAIIYEEEDNKVYIADLLFNTKIDNEEQKMDIENIVIMQIRLALEQIGIHKEIDISNLNNKQQEIYYKAINLTDEIDIERGVGHAR